MLRLEHRSTGAQVCSGRKARKHRPIGQAVIEFAFGMIIFGLIVFGLVQCFRWVMVDLAERRVDHERILTNNNINTEAQLNPNFHRVRKIDAVLPVSN